MVLLPVPDRQYNSLILKNASDHTRRTASLSFEETNKSLTSDNHGEKDASSINSFGTGITSGGSINKEYLKKFILVSSISSSDLSKYDLESTDASASSETQSIDYQVGASTYMASEEFEYTRAKHSDPNSEIIKPPPLDLFQVEALAARAREQLFGHFLCKCGKYQDSEITDYREIASRLDYEDDSEETAD